MLPSDETYTMVEDELHDIAHQFTRSLHRAEYQRLQALAATRNASSISEIQRPNNSPCTVQGTLEHGTRAKRPQDVNQPNGEEGFSSDEEEKERMSQWQGSNLGALMLSPGQRKKDLSAKWKMKATTRAAAGFHRGKIDVARQKLPLNSSPGVARSSKYNGVSISKVYSAPSDTSEDDDDLDAAIMKIDRRLSTSRANVGTVLQMSKLPRNELPRCSEARLKTTVPPVQISSPKIPNTVPIKHASPISPNSPVFDDFLSLPTPRTNILGTSGYRGKAMTALAKRRKIDQIN